MVLVPALSAYEVATLLALKELENFLDFETGVATEALATFTELDGWVAVCVTAA